MLNARRLSRPLCGLIVLAQTIIGDIVSPRERGRYQGYFGAVYAEDPRVATGRCLRAGHGMAGKKT